MKSKWKTEPLTKCLEKFTVAAKIPKKQFLEVGKFPIISQEAEFVNGYWNDPDAVCRIDQPVVIFGDHTQVLKYVDFDFVVGADGVKVLNPREFLNAKFLKYFIQANPVPSLGYARHFRHIKNLEIPLPPLEEQKRIVAILDEAFAALDCARTHAETNLKNAHELFESWVKDEFSKIEADAELKTLPDISENLDRNRVPITKGKRKPGSIPYYGASGVVDYVEDYLFDEDLLLVSEDGANLLARTYPIAFSVSGKTWVNNHAHVLRFPNVEDQEFVRIFLDSISLEPFVSGMAQPKLNQKALNKIPIPFPKVATRGNIVDRANKIATSTKIAAERYESKLKELDKLRQSLLQKAISGELT